MGLPRTQESVYAYCNGRDFISAAEVEQLKEDGASPPTLVFALEDFLDCDCPKCGITGHFRWHFLGRLKHPDCSYSWYVGPGIYMVEQIRRSFLVGMEIGADAHADAKKKRESGGWLGAIFGFIFGVILRLCLAILTIPIQAVLSLSQAKPQQPGTNPS